MAAASLSVLLAAACAVRAHRTKKNDMFNMLLVSTWHRDPHLSTCDDSSLVGSVHGFCVLSHMHATWALYAEGSILSSTATSLVLASPPLAPPHPSLPPSPRLALSRLAILCLQSLAWSVVRPKLQPSCPAQAG